MTRVIAESNIDLSLEHNAQQSANNAEETATTAQTTASQAQSTAETANTNAAQAKETADAAQSIAETAQQSADDAAKTATNYILDTGEAVAIAQMFQSISIGALDSAHIEITPEMLAFKNEQNQTVAYVRGDSLVIPIATLLTEMRVGYNPEGNGLWSWATRSNKHLQLKWIGGEQ